MKTKKSTHRLSGLKAGDCSGLTLSAPLTRLYRTGLGTVEGSILRFERLRIQGDFVILYFLNSIFFEEDEDRSL
jgi:hypothetical protein